jgi:hypothetical protein
MARLARSIGPNRTKLRGEWVAAEREWREAVAQSGLDLYDDAAEGRMVGRGKNKEPDELRKLFMAAQEARDAYFGE